jgi:hypothetical protein
MDNMINKFFTNPGRFIKMFFAITAIVFFAWGPIQINNVHAQVAFTDFMPIKSNKDSQKKYNTYYDHFITNDFVKVNIRDNTDDTTSIGLRVILQPKMEGTFTTNKNAKVVTDTNKNGKLDSGDELGSWDAILDSGLEKSTNGIFLRLYKKNTKGILEEVSFTTNSPEVEKSSHDGNDKNISWLFWNPAENFFNQTTFSVVFDIIKLEPNTTYTAMVVIKEDNAITSGRGAVNSAYSETVAEFTTRTAPRGPSEKPVDPQLPGSEKSTEKSNATIESGYICDPEGSFLGVDVTCGIIKAYIYIITLIPNLIAGVVGTIADFVMNLSIGHGVYQKFSDISFKAWKIVRDVANLVIIFSLFLAAFNLILGGGNDEENVIYSKFGSPQKIIAKTIIVALFINFSFFFSRILIDAGNVSSRFIYNQIGVTGSVGTDASIIDIFKNEDDQVKDISIALLSQVQPQQLLLGDVKAGSAEGNSAYLIAGHLTFFADLIFIFLFMTILVLFLGRMIMLILLTILSPLAFATLPFSEALKNQEYIGFSSWLKQISGNAFLGTVYFFFVYLAIMMTNITIDMEKDGSWASSGSNTLFLVAGMFFKLGVMFFVLFYGKKIAIKMSGVIGEYVTKFANTASGFAIGAATGGTALLARQTAGRLGSAVANSDRLLDAQAKGGALGSIAGGLRNFGKGVGASTFDVRNSKGLMGGFNKATNALGGETIEMGEKYLQKEGGFTTEGTLAEQYRIRRKAIADKAAAQKTEDAAILEKDIQAKAAQAMRVQQEKIDATNNEKAAKEAEVRNNAYNQQGFVSIVNNKEKEMTDTKAQTEAQKKATEKIDVDIKKLQDERAKEVGQNGKSDSHADVKAIDDKIKAAQKSRADALVGIDKKYQEKRDKLQTEIDLLKEMENKSMREVQNEIDKTVIEAKNSQEKRNLDEADEKIKKPKEELDKAQAEFNANKKLLENLRKDNKDGKNDARIASLTSEEGKLLSALDEKKTKHDEAKKKLDEAKKAYNNKFKNKIELLEKSIKDSVRKHMDDNRDSINEIQDRATQQELVLKDMQFGFTEEANQRKQTYANDLENRSSNRFHEVTAVITGGAVFGGRVNNANQRAAGNIRNSITGNNNPPAASSGNK